MVKKLLKVFLWLVGLVLVMGLGLMAYFFIMGRDITPSDDSDLRIIEPRVPDAENTYVAFLAVTNLCTLSNDEAAVCRYYLQWRRDGMTNKLYRACHVDAAQARERVDRILAAHAPYFEGLHKAVALPEYRFVKEDGVYGWMAFPSITAMMRANTLWTIKAMRETDRHDYTAALETVRDHLAFGRKVAEHAENLVQLLVGLGIADCAYGSSQSLAVGEGVPEDVLAALAVMVRDEIDMRSAFAHAVKGEYMRISDSLRDNEIALGLLLPFLPAESKMARWCCWMPGYSRFSLQPGATRQLYANAIRQLLRGEDVKKIMDGPCMFLVPNWAGRLLTRTNVPDDLEGIFMERILHARFARVVIAAQRYRHQQGAYPKSLEELVPQYLEAVPRDPFAPSRTLNYSAEREIIWSVGKDGDFNPMAEKVHSYYKPNRDMSRYALRLDGRPPEPRRQKKGGKSK